MTLRKNVSFSREQLIGNAFRKLRCQYSWKLKNFGTEIGGMPHV